MIYNVILFLFGFCVSSLWMQEMYVIEVYFSFKHTSFFIFLIEKCIN